MTAWGDSIEKPETRTLIHLMAASGIIYSMNQFTNLSIHQSFLFHPRRTTELLSQLIILYDIEKTEIKRQVLAEIFLMAPLFMTSFLEIL
jgi:hypothetical protein